MSTASSFRSKASRVWAATKALFMTPNFPRAVIAFSIFAALAIVLEFLPLYTFARIALMVFQVFVLLMWLKGMYDAFMSTGDPGGDQLAMGLWVFQFGSLYTGAWALSQRVFDQQWMLVSDWLTLGIYIQLLGAALHITGPRGPTDLAVPRTNWVTLLTAAALGGAITAAIMSFGPDLAKVF